MNQQKIDYVREIDMLFNDKDLVFPNTNKIVVYTANFGGKDNFEEINKEKGIDYFYFTDSDTVKSDTWQVIRVNKTHNPRKQARWYKTHPHVLFPDAEYSVWKDAKVKLLKPVGVFLALMDDTKIMFRKHPVRKCIYEEGETCKNFGLDHGLVIDTQLRGYREIGYPKDNGLVETQVTIRKHSEGISKFNEAWWNEINEKSIRDQISCNFVMTQLGIKYSIYPADFISKGRHLHNG